MRYLTFWKVTAIATLAVTLSWVATARGQPPVVPLLGGTPIPIQPPYFVMAWTGTDTGVIPLSRINTLESTDGATWMRLRFTPAPISTDGAAVAYDGTRTWMVMWNSGGSLNFVTGIGGMPTTPATGITWFAGSATRLPTTTSARGTPAVAFGNGSFVAVFQDGTGMLRMVPSVFPRPATETDVPLGFAGTDPALAFGAGRFVLAFVDTNRNLVARTSMDGLCWSAPETIFPFTRLEEPEGIIYPSGVSLSFTDGAFYATGKRNSRFPETDSNIIGSRIAVFKSSDGVSWQTVTDAGPAVDMNAGIPGAAFARCQLVLAYDTGLFVGANVGTQVAAPDLCTGPSSFTFGSLLTLGIGTAPTAQPGRKMAVVFSEGGGPYLESTPRLGFPDSISFGSVAVGDSKTRTLTIRNTSDVPATISLPASRPGIFEWGAFNGVLDCGGARDLVVEFTPGGPGVTQATLTFTSNAAGSPHSIILRGRGLEGEPP